jgi:glycosyltransferase involved in cell wall biosynthesis
LYTFHAPVHRELLAERQGSYLLPRPAQGMAVRGLRACEAMVARKAAGLIALSEFMQRQVADLDSDAGQRTRLIPGGVDTSRFCPGAVDGDSWTRSASPLILVARRLVPRTGVSRMVQAMPAILTALPRARLVIAGDGLDRRPVQDVVDRLDLRGAVRLVGRVSDSELVAWYRRADLAVTPTQELEGFGLATAEALACGTPALVTPVGANSEVAQPVSARLVSRGKDPAALAESVVSLCADLPALARMADAARSRVHPALSWDRVVDRHLDLYQEMSAARPRGISGSAP